MERMRRAILASVRAAAVLAVALGLAVLSVVTAKAFTIASESTWGGPDSDGVDGVATAPDGSLYLVGTTFSFGTQPPSLFLLKYERERLPDLGERLGGLRVLP